MQRFLKSSKCFLSSVCNYEVVYNKYWITNKLCCFVFSPLDCFVEFHDYPSGSGGPAARHRGCQGEARTRGEEEPAYSGECREQEAAEGDRRQNLGGLVIFTGEHPRG